ncbi:MAG: xanthine dehydrogenase family protein molybdopterin-binding subunit [Acidimicrobiia bacterium]|nr:MAG: xanthine dehydrogenase family protein molybdopterin-binding subunit [Acidimicrobiia bacterium]
MISLPPGARPRPEGQDEIERLVTGNGRYVADLVPDDALHCWFVRSPFAHGHLRGVEVAEARRAPGVVAVYTAADLDVPDLSFVLGAGPDAKGMDRPVLARDRVRFVGEAMAMVIADSRPRAEDGAGMVWADIDPLPAVTTFVDAMADEVVLFPDAGSNVVTVTELAEGPEPSADDLIEVSVEVDHPRLAPSPLETLQILAMPDDGRLLVWCGHQAPHQLRAQLSTFLGLPEEAIRVTVPDVGGAFGMKRIYPEYVAVARAALLLDRPVMWSATRTELFLAGTHGRAQHHRVTLTADPTGRIHQARFELATDTGAYPHTGGMIGDITRLVASGLYAIPRIEYETTIFVTNKAPTAPYRGAGRPEAALAIERAVDALARALDLDPADVRRTNFVDAWPYQTPTGAVYDSGDYRAALDRALDLVDYPSIRAEQQRRRDADEDPIGIGIGAFVERAGGGADSGEYGSVEIAGDGRVIVRTGSTAAGQGHEAVWRGLVASMFTIETDAVTFVAGDTDAVPRGVGSFASRSAQIGASAVWRVAGQARDRARDVAAELMEASPGDLVLDHGMFSVVGSTHGGVTLAEAAARAEASGEPIFFEEFYVPGSQTFPYGVHVAVVEVSRETGAVSLERMVTVDDVGTVLDEELVEAQLHGSLMQGVGAALLEEMYYDEHGQPLTASFTNYVLPGSGSRLNLTAERLEHPAPSNPLGVKGAGEGGCIGAPPAILNATIDALAPYGVTDLQLPLLPHRIWEALHEAGQTVGTHSPPGK